MDLINRLIGVVLVLFLLSLIVEKLVELVKKYPYLKWVLPPHYVILIISFLRVKILKKSQIRWIGKTLYNKEQSKKDKKKEITVLAVSLGFVVAVLFDADLLLIIRVDDPTSVLGYQSMLDDFEWGWLWYPGFEFWLKLVGLSLTGFFLSFGSQLFHDLLDRLYFIKNTKRQLMEDGQPNENNQPTNSPDQPPKDPEEAEENAAKQVLVQHRNFLKSLVGVIGVGMGVSDKRPDDLAIKLYVDGATYKNQAPKAYRFTDSDGGVYEFDVDVEDEGIAEINSKVGIGIYNDQNVSNVGTLGCFITLGDSEKTYFLTCYHAVKPQNRNWDDFARERRAEETVKDVNGIVIGRIKSGYRNGQYDVALVEVEDPNYDISNTTVSNVGLRGAKYLTPEELKKKPRVHFEGHATPGVSSGQAIEKGISFSIKYAADDFWELQNLVALTRFDNQGNKKPISMPGDSGAGVYDQNENLVGLIVGGSKKRSFMMPIQEMLDFLWLEIGKKPNIKQ